MKKIGVAPGENGKDLIQAIPLRKAGIRPSSPVDKAGFYTKNRRSDSSEPFTLRFYRILLGSTPVSALELNIEILQEGFFE